LQARKPVELTPEQIEAFAKLMRSIISRVEVDDGRVRIIGEKASLANVIADRETSPGNIRGFVGKWRTRHDSNV
jgi:hypothetical protein